MIGKRTVFKVLKDSPENFTDLSTLADCDTDKSIDAASKLVCRLYDQKGKLKEDHVDLNKLRVRLATLRDACLAKLPPCEATFTQHVLRSSLQINIGGSLAKHASLSVANLTLNLLRST
jgi:hypothetical protein